jgi:hypothetical protein
MPLTVGCAALAAAKAGWRAEVHSLTPTDFQTEIAGYEAVNAQVPITGLRWVIAHVPFITADYVERLAAVGGGGVNLTPYEYFGTTSPGGPPYRLLVDSGIPVGPSSDGMQIAPMNPWIHAYYATTGINALGDQINPGQQLTPRRSARALHHRQPVVPRRARRGPEEPALRADHPRRHGRALGWNPGGTVTGKAGSSGTGRCSSRHWRRPAPESRSRRPCRRRSRPPGPCR